MVGMGRTGGDYLPVMGKGKIRSRTRTTAVRCSRSIIPHLNQFVHRVETHMNGIHTRTMKIIKPYISMRAPRLRTSLRHGGAVRCL